MPRARRRAPRPGRLVTWRQILPAFCLTQIIGQGTGVQAAASLRDHALKSHLVDSDIEAGATTRRSKPCANASHGIIRPEAIARSNAIFGCAPAKLKCPRSVGLTPRPRAIFVKAASDAPPARITPFIGPQVDTAAALPPGNRATIPRWRCSRRCRMRDFYRHARASARPPKSQVCPSGTTALGKQPTPSNRGRLRRSVSRGVLTTARPFHSLHFRCSLRIGVEMVP